MDFLALFLLHAVLTAGYFLINLRRKPRLHVVTETIIVFAIPFFGLFLMLAYRFSCYVLNLKGERQDESDNET